SALAAAISRLSRRSVVTAGLAVLSLSMDPAWCETALAPSAPGWNWSGPYIGLHAGATWGASTATHAGSPESLFAADTPPLPAASRVGGSGIMAGAQWGYDHLIGSALIGLESDVSLTSRAKSDGHGGILSDGRPFTYTAAQNLTWLGTLRARLGYAPVPHLLLYATGGLAYGRGQAAAVFDITGVPMRNYRAVFSDLRVGWAAGLGAEYALADTWSARVEYLRYDLGAADAVGLPTPANDGVSTHSRFALAGDLVRIGLNYRPRATWPATRP